MNEQDFLKEAASIFPYLQEMRRCFHHHPELGDHEEWTSERIAQELTSMGIEVSRPVGTAVVGLLQGALPGRVAALRADMDALPITEHTGLPFSSEISGVMHACGHDLHITAALGRRETACRSPGRAARAREAVLPAQRGGHRRRGTHDSSRVHGGSPR